MSRAPLFVLRHWDKIHTCTEACETRDLMECFEEVEIPLRSRKTDSARIEAQRIAARDGLTDPKLARVLTAIEQLECVEEWSEAVGPPEHLASCYVANGASHSKDYSPFWVCGPRCPVPKKAR